MSRNSLSGYSTINSPVVYGNINLANGTINNNYCCQLVSNAAQTISITSVYTKLNTIIPSATYGFENNLNGSTNTDMYVGSNQITIRKAGKYLILFKSYLEIGTTSGTFVLGKNGAVFDTLFQLVPQGYPAYMHGVFDLAVGDTISAYVAVGTVGDVGGNTTYEVSMLFVGLLN